MEVLIPTIILLAVIEKSTWSDMLEKNLKQQNNTIDHMPNLKRMILKRFPLVTLKPINKIP